jgi:hypothetical protein
MGLQQLRVSGDGRHIVRQDGSAFFWLGDTAWVLFHRSTREEVDLYLADRAAKGFNVIQAMVLAEPEGLTAPNSYGEFALIDNDPTRPNDRYFAHIDYVVNRAAALGIYIAMLPTWGDKWNHSRGTGPEVFTPENALVYGRFIGERYRDQPIIWVLGGDRTVDSERHFAILRNMAEGIRERDGGGHLMTFHPTGGASSSHQMNDETWLDFHMLQSGHNSATLPNYRMVLADWKREPVRPVLDAEPCYEDSPIAFRAANGWFSEFESRRAGYWAMLSGACGHTYGHHSIWQMYLPGRKVYGGHAIRTPWPQALDYPGAFQAGYMKRLLESRRWELLQPAQKLLLDGPSTDGMEVRVAAAGDGSCLMAYAPYGSTFTLSLKELAGEGLQGWWVNPRDCTSIDIGRVEKADRVVFDPPADERRGNDWLLVVEDAGRGFGRPGSDPIR